MPESNIRKDAYIKLRDAVALYRDHESKMTDWVITRSDPEGKIWKAYKTRQDELGRAVGKAFYEYSVANDIPNGERACIQCVRPGSWLDGILKEQEEIYGKD